MIRIIVDIVKVLDTFSDLDDRTVFIGCFLLSILTTFSIFLGVVLTLIFIKP